MAWDKAGTKTEVGSLLKRYPKKGIDLTIPAQIREELDAKERQEGFKKGEQNRYAEGGEVDKELREYRKQRNYTGYEDYTPSGRVALRTYNKASETAKDWGKPPGGPVYSPSAASKAQRAQREYANEIQRETRGKAGSADSGKYAKGGKIDGCAQRGKTKGRVI